MREIIESPSPNHNERPAGKPIDILLIHYTGMRDGDAARQRLCDPVAKVSSHYLIEEDGRIHRLVDESRRAWHAGVGYWAGERDINAVSIGIELVNPGHDNGYRAFPQPQMAALIELGRAILARHPIPRWRVLGHSDIAPKRKIDPGELFDWKALAEAGIGLWPEAASGPSDLASIQRALARYGYEVAASGVLDAATTAALQAFQRHFRPALIDGQPDAETAALLAGLLKSLG
ncbi:MAG TPA: N-acetylmuramoyl-L-alanine amidase [Dongiaceae bacterium]